MFLGKGLPQYEFEVEHVGSHEEDCWKELLADENMFRRLSTKNVDFVNPSRFFETLLLYKLSIFLREVDVEKAMIPNNVAMTLLCDIHAINSRDPACRGASDVIQYYKTFDAILIYRAAHEIYINGDYDLARRLNYYCTCQYGIDIHPAAQIGPGCFIDHGTGVVIGETCIIGSNVSIMQGVTLGGNGKETGDRHPIVKDGVLIGAGAKILGRITLGNSVKVGAGSVVLNDVPDRCTIVGVPGRVVANFNIYPSLEMDHKVNQYGDRTLEPGKK